MPPDFTQDYLCLKVFAFPPRGNSEKIDNEALLDSLITDTNLLKRYLALFIDLHNSVKTLPSFNLKNVFVGYDDLMDSYWEDRFKVEQYRYFTKEETEQDSVMLP